MSTYNISRLLRHHAERRPNAEAVVHGDMRTTYREFDSQVDAVAAGLQEHNIGDDDIVALLASNRIEYLVFVLAAARVGAIVLPLNWRLAPPEVRYILEHAGATAIVTDPPFLDVALAVLPDLPALRLQILFPDGETATPTPDGWTTLAQLTRSGGHVRDVDRDVDDTHCIMYTSGTTSRPKGVMLTHGNVLWNCTCHQLALDLGHDDRVLVGVPLFHVSGLHAMSLSVLHAGGTLVLPTTTDPRDLVQLGAAEGLTSLGFLASQTMGAILGVDDLDAGLLHGVRSVITAAVSPDVWRQWRDRFPDMRLSYGYGMTELCSGIAYSSEDVMDVPDKFSSSGTPFPFHDVRVVDDEGTEVAAGEPGELLWRGPKVCRGYWRDPERTAETFHNGWLASGDIGSVDGDGHVRFLDRKKDMIKSGGENIASAEVERVLMEHPNIAEAAVVGVPDPQWDEVGMAFVVTATGDALDEEEVRAHCAGQLARFKIPKHFATMAALPRNSSGKVLKRVLREEGHGYEPGGE